MKIFHYVAAKEDEKFLNELKMHMSNIKKQNPEWTFRTADINDDCDVEVLFISSNFLNYYGDDLEQLMQRKNRKEVVIIPILTRPCDYSGTPISILQSIPRSEKPLSEHKDLDKAMYDVVVEIREIIKKY